MADFSIRLYKDSDYEAVREIYSCGVMEYCRPGFKHAIQLPQSFVFLLFAFFVPFIAFGSMLISVLAFVSALVAIWLGIRMVFQDYVREAILDDLQDTKTYYLKRDGYCFWVAESAGQVVGIVAAVPSFNSGGQKHVQLKRMSIVEGYRGKGIAKVLCKTVLDFARKRGCEAVILTTLTTHTAAQQMYQRIGFRQRRKIYSTKLINRLLGINTLFYQYDLLTDN